MPQNPNTVRNLQILLHLGFFISGITTILIGQILPILASRFELNDLQVSYFFPAQFAGSITGAFLFNWFGKQNKFLAASLIGCFLMGIGILMLNLSSFELCLLGFYCNGVGVGMTLPSINMLTLELNPHRATSAVNILNFVWGLGAIICSQFYSLFKSIGYFPISVLLATALFLIGSLLLLIPKEIEQKPTADDKNSDDFSTPIWTNPIAWLIAGFNFIHVGFETGMGGWLPTYTERLEGQGYIWWLAPIFLFWLFFVGGRGVAPIFLRFLNENQLLFMGLLIILLGMGILLFAKDVLILGIGAGIAGFGTSSIFPTNLSRFTKTFGPSASRRAMPFFICGTLGATFTTQTIGWTSNHFNSLHSGMFILLGSGIVLIVLQTILQFRGKPQIALE
ncbi:MAG TPA: MFS transporter [Pyrinomonadaceae bacterium]|nr:MFS transporter [Pyrinomonadaceae bacterium]